MSDLISRRHVLNKLNRNSIFKAITNSEGHSAVDIVENAPNAFDIEEVINKLKELKTYKLYLADAMSEIMKRDKLGTYVCLEDVIEIIKGQKIN